MALFAAAVGALAPDSVEVVEVPPEDMASVLPTELQGAGDAKWARQREAYDASA